ncbi:MAG: type II toxin-antitoxin system VapC family toxin [Chloroflexota bacterium]
MKRYLLDTSLLASLLLDRPAAVELIRPWIVGREVATSILVYAEVCEYLKGFSDIPQHHAALRMLLREVHPYTLTFPTLERYADVRRSMRRRQPGLIGDVDTLIAATALERGLQVVTADRDFERVPDLGVRLIPRSALELRR